MKKFLRISLFIAIVFASLLLGLCFGVRCAEVSIASSCAGDGDPDGSTPINGQKFFCVDYDRFNIWLAAHARPSLGA